MKHLIASTLSVLAVALATAAPAHALGVSYDYGRYSPSVGGPAGLLEPPTPFTSFPLDSVGFRFDAFAHAVTLFDDSGILAGGIGAAGAAETSRREAEREAVRHGARQGDSYSYLVRERAFVPGLQSSLRVAFGGGQGAELSFDNKTFVASPALTTSFWAGVFHADLPGFTFFDVPRLVGLDPKGPAWLDLNAALSLELLAGQYSVKGTHTPTTGAAQTINRSSLMVNFPVTLTVDLNPLPGLHVLPSAGYDIVGGLNALFGQNRQGYTYGLGLRYSPLEWIYASADLRNISSGLGDQTFDNRSLTAGVGLNF